MSRTWHEYFRDFLIGFGKNKSTASTCFSSYISKEIFGLWMPDDFLVKGKDGVFSSTIIRERYIIEELEKTLEPKLNRSEYSRVGKILSLYDRDELCYTAIYVFYE